MKLSDLSSDRSLRHIAMAVDSLDRAAADALLERLPREHEQAVRDQMIDLDNVDPVEREYAARQFYQRIMESMGIEQAPQDSNGSRCDDGQEETSHRSIAAVAATVGTAAAATTAVAGFGDEYSRLDDQVEPIDTLISDSIAQDEPHAVGEQRIVEVPSEPADDTDALIREQVPTDLLPLRSVVEAGPLEHLSTVLRDEQPQTVALVMAAMLPAEAADFIGGWPSAEQGEILRRIAKLGRTDSVVVDTVRSGLLNQLQMHADDAARGEEGRERVQAIVAAAQGSVRHDLLGGLAEADRELFRQVAVAADQSSGDDGAGSQDEFDPHLAAVAFDRFVDLSDAGLERVFDELDPDVAVLALAGASQPCLSDVLERLPQEKSEGLRRRMENIGSLRLGDIQRAQLMAVAASHHILSDGAEMEPVRHLKLTA